MSIILVITKFFPLIIMLIQLLERLFPGGKLGGFKLSIAIKVLQLLQPYLAAGNINLDKLMEMVPAIIALVVSELNATPAAWVTASAEVASTVGGSVVVLK